MKWESKLRQHAERSRKSCFTRLRYNKKYIVTVAPVPNHSSLNQLTLSGSLQVINYLTPDQCGVFIVKILNNSKAKHVQRT
jgi:hypothetical protein